MKLLQFVFVVTALIITVPSISSIEANATMQVPFWFETDPVTGDEIYIDHFRQANYVMKEYHNDFVAQQTTLEIDITTVDSTDDLDEPSGMVEKTIYEYQYIPIRESQFDHGLFANPDFIVRELVPVTIWVPVPEPVIVVPEPVEPESVEIVVPVPEPVEAVVPITITPEPLPPITNPLETLKNQELKDYKVNLERERAEKLLAKMYPGLY